MTLQKMSLPIDVKEIYNQLKHWYCETQYYMRTYGLTEQEAEDCNYSDIGATIQMTYREHRKLMKKAQEYSLIHLQAYNKNTMFIDHQHLRDTINARKNSILVNATDPQWLAAFAAYNSKHNTSERLNTNCSPCYTKVLAFVMNNNITQI